MQNILFAYELRKAIGLLLFVLGAVSHSRSCGSRVLGRKGKRGFD
jgi:hypothetical protein